MGKAEIARNEQFLLSPVCFLPFLRNLHHSCQIQDCCLQTLSILISLNFVIWERVYLWSALAFNLGKPKILLPGNGLNDVINVLEKKESHTLAKGGLVYL